VLVQAYALRRVAQLAPVLLFTSLMVFFVFRLIPGDPAEVRLGESADPQSIAEVRKEMGLDRPISVQYLIWLGGALHGDLGRSNIDQQPVLTLVLQKFPVTLELAVLGILFALVISVPIGILSALRQGGGLDQLARLAALLGFCVPRYWLAGLLILFFAVRLRWLPPAGYVAFTDNPGQNLRDITLPVVSLALTLAAVQMRFLRSGLLEVIREDYVRTAHAKGLPSHLVVRRHALKNALIPFVTVVGLQFGGLLGGLVVIEQIFSWPGVGWLMVQSIGERDYAVVEGVVLLVATGFVVVNLLVDLLYALLDPRIHYR